MIRLAPLALLLAACSPGSEREAADALAAEQVAPPPTPFSLAVSTAVTTQPLRFVATGVPAGARVNFVVSANVTAPGLCPAATAPTCLDVAGPIITLGSAIANASGVAQFSLVLPAAVPARVEFQAYSSFGGSIFLSNGQLSDVLPAAGDVDGDGLTNAAEIGFGSSPLLADTDGDGAFDNQELSFNLDPNDVDTDGDGLLDGQELAAGTDGLLSDTDGDTLGDFFEVTTGFADPTLFDTDGDGASDGEEEGEGTDPRNVDTDGDGLGDNVEDFFGTNPLNEDTDDDMLDDLTETTGNYSDPVVADTDADGLLDGEEFARGTDPRRFDTDNDGVGDLLETINGSDPLNPDTDGDGANDGEEEAEGTNPLDTDTDDDGLGDNDEDATLTNPLVADTDSGGVSDGAEVLAGTDPLNPADDLGGPTIGPRLLMVEVVDHQSFTGARFVEIYNSGDETATLSGMSIRRYSNGSSVPTTLPLTLGATLAPGQSWVIANSSSVVNGFPFVFGVEASQYNSGINSNGDDVYELFNGTATVDVFGIIGTLPPPAPPTWSFVDSVVKRLPGIVEPTATFDLAEWSITFGDSTAAPFDRN